MSKFLRILADILMFVLIGCALALLLPSLFGVATVIVGKNMATNSEVGSVAYGEKIPLEELAIGDTIVYSGEDFVYLCEVISGNPETGELTVDIGTGENKEITLHRTAVRKILVVPFIGYFSIALQSTKGIIILALVVAVIVILFVLSHMIGRRKRYEEEEDEEEEDDRYFRELAKKKKEIDRQPAMTGSPDQYQQYQQYQQPQPQQYQQYQQPQQYQQYQQPQYQQPQYQEPHAAPYIQPLEKEAFNTAQQRQDPRAAFAQEDDGEDFAYEGVNAAAATAGAAVAGAAAGAAIAGAAASPVEVEAYAARSSTAAIPINDVNTINNLEFALESALANTQTNSHSDYPPMQNFEEEPDYSVNENGEIELAMPVKTLEEILQDAYAAGDDPLVTKDKVTGISFVDLSDSIRKNI